MLGCTTLWFIINPNTYFRLPAVFWHLFSQSSVATYFRCGGIFKYGFVANLPTSLSVRNFENRLLFGEVMGKSLVSWFCWLTVYNGSKLRIGSAVWHLRLHVATCIFRLVGLPVTFWHFAVYKHTWLLTYSYKDHGTISQTSASPEVVSVHTGYGRGTEENRQQHSQNSQWAALCMCCLLCSAWSHKYWIISMATSTAKSIKHRFCVCLSGSSSCCSDVWIDRVKIHYPCISWWRGTVVERRSLAGELSLSCARPAADGWPLI